MAGLPVVDLSEFVVELSSGGQARQAPLFSRAIQADLAVFKNSLRVTLVAPADAFGHQTYASRMADAALHHQPFPAPPYIPVVTQLWLDYER